MEHWFSSDWHLNHHNLIKNVRHEFSSVDYMNELILKNMFDNINRGDQFYFLGDMVFGSRPLLGRVLDIIKEKKLHFHWIIGNHDKKVPKAIYVLCDSSAHLKNIKIDNQKVTLCHYPMVSWNCSHYGAWQLFGHHHRKNYAGKTPIRGKQLNVNCEFNNYEPYTFNEIKNVMEALPNNWDYIEEKK